MNTTLKLLHLFSAMVWMGGMTAMLFAVRPSAIATLQSPERLRFLAQSLQRFFVLVWVSIAVLLVTGVAMYGLGSAAAVAARKAAGLAAGAGPLMPLGWNLMLGLGFLMFAVFGHIYFSGFKKLLRAVALADWPAGAAAMAKIHPMMLLNFGLGWAAMGAVRLL